VTTLSVVMIARDEVHNVEPCLASVWDGCDQVVVVDTGSTDGTLAAAREYAYRRGEPDKLVAGMFRWDDDFAAARNYADSLASSDWLVSMDLDDRAVGLEHLRAALAHLPPQLGVILWGGGREGEEPVHRPRVYRAGLRWHYRIHEIIKWPQSCQVMQLDAAVTRWIETRRGDRPRSLERNLRVAERWAAEEPDNGVAAFWIAETHRVARRWPEAVSAALDGITRPRPALELYTLLAVSRCREDDLEGAIRWVREGLALQRFTDWPLGARERMAEMLTVLLAEGEVACRRLGDATRVEGPVPEPDALAGACVGA